MQTRNDDSLCWIIAKIAVDFCPTMNTQRYNKKYKKHQAKHKKRQPEGCLFCVILLKYYFLITFCTVLFPSAKKISTKYIEGAKLLKLISLVVEVVATAPLKLRTSTLSMMLSA